MQDTSDPMDLDLPMVVETDSDLVRVLAWSIENDQQQLRNEIVGALHHRKDYLSGLLNADSFPIVCEALGLMHDEEFWLQHLHYHLLAEAKSPDYFHFFKMLLSFPYSSNSMLAIENLCIEKLKATMDEKLLVAMMDIKSLPVEKNLKALSSEWYWLLEQVISQANFKLFRMIVADWWNFKVRTNLANLICSGSKHSYYREISLLAEVIEHARSDMAWLLSGRTWYFHLFKHPVIRLTKQFEILSSMIPELKMVPWDSNDFNTCTENGTFIMKINSNYPNHIDAQCLVLTSSFCPHDIKGYIVEAISNHHTQRVIAAAKCSKLLPEHLHLVHVAGDDFKCCYGSLTEYLGKPDISYLQFRHHGRVAAIISQRGNLFYRRALRRMNWFISQMGTKMTYMEILLGLDRVYALNKIEQDVFVQLNGISADLAKAFLAEPALIADSEAFGLLKFYQEHQHKDFAFELLIRVPSERAAQLIKTISGPFAGPL